MTQEHTTDPELNFGMTDLEEQLSSENGAAVKTDTLTALLSAGTRVKKAMDAGLAAKAFQTGQTTYTALAAAHEVVANFPTSETTKN